MNNYKTTKIAAIALIMAIIATSFFLIVKITSLFVVAYIFTIIGISLFFLGSIYLLHSMKNYPWFAIFPITVFRYLIIQIIVSALFVTIENLFSLSLPTPLLLIIHIALLGFFGVLLIIQKGGKEIIEELDEKIQEKYIDLHSIQLDVEAVKERVPDQAKEIGTVIDALRYSLPMSHDSIKPYEDKIKDSVVMLEQAADNNYTAKISEICVTLLRQIKDRNNRAKLMK